MMGSLYLPMVPHEVARTAAAKYLTRWKQHDAVSQTLESRHGHSFFVVHLMPKYPQLTACLSVY